MAFFSDTVTTFAGVDLTALALLLSQTLATECPSMRGGSIDVAIDPTMNACRISVTHNGTKRAITLDGLMMRSAPDMPTLVGHIADYFLPNAATLARDRQLAERRLRAAGRLTGAIKGAMHGLEA